MAWGNLGNFVGLILQDYTLAREYYEKIWGLSRLLGERGQEALVLSNMGWVSEMLGDFDAAFSYYARSRPLLREEGNVYAEICVLINLSANTGVRNEIDASLDYSQKALELSIATEDKSNQARSYLYMGYAYLAQGKFTPAANANSGAFVWGLSGSSSYNGARTSEVGMTR